MELIDIDIAEEKFKELQSHFDTYEDQILTEEDAKIQLITDTLIEVLGWPKEMIAAERNSQSGYSDYLIGGSGAPQYVVEAKRLNKFEIKVAEKDRMRPIKLSNNALREAIDAIIQARNYADDQGLTLCVVTDGDAWIVFKTHVPGKNFKEAEGFVFPSLQAVEKKFSEFYDLLSYEQVPKRIYSQLFDEIHNQRALIDQTFYFPITENQNRLKSKTKMGHDLDRVFEVYFGKLRGDDDPDLLIDCFVETRESRIADFSLEKIASKIISNISPNDKDIGENLARIVEHSIEIDEGQTVFIVGPSGSGKTTFVERFFRKTLDQSLRDRCVAVRLSCLDAGGDLDRIVSWMTNRLVELLEAALFQAGHPSYDQLQGMYFGEYKRRMDGPWAALYKKDPTQFKVNFGEFLEYTVNDDREGYLKRLLEDIVTNRQMLPVLIIDNIDEFSQPIKEALFQLTQALRRHVRHALIIFPITDKSAWSFAKSDIFGIYPSVSFFLPTPSPREVFSKRIEYLRQKLDEDSQQKEKVTYQSQKGIKISIGDLNAFAGVLEQVFIDDEFSAKTLGEFSNYNIRRTLSLAKRVITSPIFDVDALVTSALSGTPITTSFNLFLGALLKGDYEYYRSDDTHNVFPIFQVDNKIRQSPLLALRVLSLLEAASIGGQGVEERHLSVQSILDFFDTLSVSEAAISEILNKLLTSRLIEPFDMSVSELSDNQMIAITHAGRIHFNLASRNRVFFEQMALTTGITDVVASQVIKTSFSGNGSFTERLEAVRTTFSDYLIREDSIYVSTIPTHERYDHQQQVSDRIRAFGQPENPDDNSDEPVIVVPVGKLNATVERVIRDKGYAFVSIADVGDRIFLHFNTIDASDYEDIYVGDEIVCDLEQTPKGMAVSSIYEIAPPTDRIDIQECEVIRLFHDRHYGFARMPEKNADAFFPFHALPFYPNEGDTFTAEVLVDLDGQTWQVRRLTQLQT